MSEQLEAVRRLRDENKWGAIRIGNFLGISRQQAERALNKLKLADAHQAVPAVTLGNAVSIYDAACRALAAAVKVDEIKVVLDVAAAITAYGKQAKNYEIEANGRTLRERGERRMGEKIVEAKKLGLIAEGRPPSKNGSEAEQLSRITLEEAGIDRKLSARAQKKAGISARAFDAMIEGMREKVISGHHAPDILRDGPINGGRAVMANRNEPDDSLDFFPTPPWGTRALM